MAEGQTSDRLQVPYAVLGVMISLTVVCIGAVVRDKVAIARLEEQAGAIRARVSHLEASVDPTGYRSPPGPSLSRDGHP